MVSNYKLFFISKYKQPQNRLKRFRQIKVFRPFRSSWRNRPFSLSIKKVFLFSISLPALCFFLFLLSHYRAVFTFVTPPSSSGLLPIVEAFKTSSAMDENERKIPDSEISNRYISLDEIDDFVTENGASVSMPRKNPFSERSQGSSHRGKAKEYKHYLVKKGDTLWKIARDHSLRIDTLMSKNRLAPFDILRIGQKLKISSSDGLYYRVKVGDTLSTISRRYNLHINEIKRHNDLGEHLVARQELFLPNVRYSETEKELLFGGFFVAPVQGFLTSSYGLRIHPITRKRSFHTGVDIGGNAGKKVKVSREGTVIYAGKNGNYGYYVKVKHQLGFETSYGHLHHIIVKVGQKVNRKEVIGTVGNTGSSTGPHLHFEIKQNGRFINPARFIKFFKKRA